MSTEQYVWSWIATGIEVCIAIIGACLPTLLPVYRFLSGRQGPSSKEIPRHAPLKSIITFGRRSSRNPTLFTAAELEERGSFNQLHSLEVLPPHGYVNTQQTRANGGTESRPSSYGDVPPHSIKTRNDVRQKDDKACGTDRI